MGSSTYGKEIHTLSCAPKFSIDIARRSIKSFDHVVDKQINSCGRQFFGCGSLSSTYEDSLFSGFHVCTSSTSFPQLLPKGGKLEQPMGGGWQQLWGDAATHCTQRITLLAAFLLYSYQVSCLTTKRIKLLRVILQCLLQNNKMDTLNKAKTQTLSIVLFSFKCFKTLRRGVDGTRFNFFEHCLSVVRSLGNYLNCVSLRHDPTHCLFLLSPSVGVSFPRLLHLKL